jgi:hypothetical protein
LTSTLSTSIVESSTPELLPAFGVISLVITKPIAMRVWNATSTVIASGERALSSKVQSSRPSNHTARSTIR